MAVIAQASGLLDPLSGLYPVSAGSQGGLQTTRLDYTPQQQKTWVRVRQPRYRLSYTHILF